MPGSSPPDRSNASDGTVSATEAGEGPVAASNSHPVKLGEGRSTGTVRFRLPPRFRYGIRAGAAVSALGVVLMISRANRSSAALADYHAEYGRRGGPFTFPADLDAAAGRDKIALAAVIVIALAIWGSALIVWALGRTLLRLDLEGLWWRPPTGLRWRGPIARTDVVALQPGARKRQARTRGIPFTSLGGKLAARLGIYEVTILYLRSEVGSSIKHASYLELPEPAPHAARSLITVPEALFRSNPKFLKRLRSWILS